MNESRGAAFGNQFGGNLGGNLGFDSMNQLGVGFRRMGAEDHDAWSRDREITRPKESQVTMTGESDWNSSWILEDEWWRKRNWSIKVKFAEERVTSNRDDALRFVTHVERAATFSRKFELGIEVLFDRLKVSQPSLLESINIDLNLTSAGVASLAKAIESGCLPSLKSLRFHNNYVDGVHYTLPTTLVKSLRLAIRSRKLNNLAEIKLKKVGLTDQGLKDLTELFQEGVPSLLPNLSSLDLSFNAFTEVGLLSLAVALTSGHLNSLKWLDLLCSTNQSKEGARALAEALSSGKLLNLTHLDMSRSDIGDIGAKYLALAIRSGELVNLVELKLNKSGLTDEGLIALTDSFQKGVASLLPNLCSLDIGLNSFTEVGLLTLFKALSSGKLPNLRYLDISGNAIGVEGAKSFGLAIRSGELKNLTKLKLNKVGLTDEELIALMDCFHEGVASLLPNLSSLDVSFNSFTERGLSALAMVLKSGHLNSLKVLDVQCSTDPSKEGARALAEALSSGKFLSLIYLDMSGSDIGVQGAKSLGLAIGSGEYKALAELKLNKVGLTDEGLIALTDSFQKGVASLLPNLICLEFSGNNLGDEGAKSLGRAIRFGKFENLAELRLKDIGLTDEGLKALVTAFEEGVASLLPKLSLLDLSFNSFTEVGLSSLAEALKSGHLNSLKVLDVQRSPDPSKEGARALVSAFSTNNCLTVDVKLEWYKFPELDRRRKQLIERNHRHKDILDELVDVPKVQATFGKVYLCGKQEVGKTTLARTLQRGCWESLFTWLTRSHVEERTRGIEVSQLSSTAKKPDESPITLAVWDMAGQEDFHLVHNAFFPASCFSEGKATTFVVVCSSENSADDPIKQLNYWLPYIASSCDKTLPNPRQVFVVMNDIGGRRIIHQHARQWKKVLEDHRDKFEQHLHIQTEPFLVDVRIFKQVGSLKNCLLEHSRNRLRNQEVPKICHAIQENLTVLSQQREQFPVLHWTEYVEQIGEQTQEHWPEHIIEAATKYLNEAGVLIYINKEGVRLVVVDPNWLCREIIGKLLLPTDMASPTEHLFRNQVDQSTGSISISSVKRFFESLESEWNDAQVDDMIAILLWLGLCYKGKDENVFIPALIAEQGKHGDHWCLPAILSHEMDQWVMGFSVKHQKNEVTLAPISLWHRFQVDLAQCPEFNGDWPDNEWPDNDFVADKYFMTFVVDHMNVLIEVDASPEKPTFQQISILVKPSPERDDLAAPERKQRQVDQADILVERLLKLWSEVCPGVEYEHRIIWPWPASCSRPEDRPGQNVEVAEVQKWVKEHGVGIKRQWVVSPGNPITGDQLLSTKDKRKLGVLSTSPNSGIVGHAREVNDSVFELYKPESTPKIQIVFFHGLQMEESSDQHLSTWQSADGSTVWPQTWLVDEISGAHVLSISYSGGLGYSSDARLDMYLIVENLLSDLLQGGVGQVPHCPVVFVGHSIGGLVIKELCCRAHSDKVNRSQSRERAKLEKFLKNVGGVFFYATPHRGGGVADILAERISSPLLTYFETLSKDAARLNSHFEDILKTHYKHWKIAGLGEAVPTTLGPLKAGVAPRKYLVVPEASARTKDFNMVEGADHVSVCRPRDKTVRSFSKLRDFVSQIASRASDAE